MNRLQMMLALGVILLTATTGCGKSEAEQASDALSQGLQAYADGRVDEAAADYREVLKHDPQNKWAYYNLGLIDQTAGRAQAAEMNYRLVLSIDPDLPSALFNLAIIRADAGSTQEAIDLYRHTIAVDSNSAGAHLNLGLLLRATGHQADGDAEVKRAVELDPKLGQSAAPTPGHAPAPNPTATPSR